MGLVTLLLVAAVPLAGGDLRRLAQVRVHLAGLLPVALGLQVLVITLVPGAWRPFTVGAHALSYVLAALFVWHNRRLPGLALLTVGALCNGITIALNGGTLPASASALTSAGLPVDVDVYTNSGVLAHPRLPWLGDVFWVPSWFPFANVFSVGDVLIVAGAAWFLLRTCRPRRSAPAAELSLPALRARVQSTRHELGLAQARQARLRAELAHLQPARRTRRRSARPVAETTPAAC